MQTRSPGSLRSQTAPRSGWKPTACLTGRRDTTRPPSFRATLNQRIAIRFSSSRSDRRPPKDVRTHHRRGLSRGRVSVQDSSNMESVTESTPCGYYIDVAVRYSGTVPRQRCPASAVAKERAPHDGSFILDDILPAQDCCPGAGFFLPASRFRLGSPDRARYTASQCMETTGERPLDTSDSVSAWGRLRLLPLDPSCVCSGNH